MPALARVARRLAFRQLLLPHFFQLLFGAEAAECLVFIEQLLRIFLIDPVAVALPVGPYSPRDRSLIPLEAEPAEIVHELLFVYRLAPLGVRVLDPKEESAAAMPCQEPVEQCRPHIPDVQQACGAGAKRTRTGF